MLYKWLPETWKDKAEHRQMKNKINAARKAAGLEPVNYSKKSTIKFLLRLCFSLIVIGLLIFAGFKSQLFDEVCNKLFSHNKPSVLNVVPSRTPAQEPVTPHIPESTKPDQGTSTKTSFHNDKRIVYNSGVGTYKTFIGTTKIESFSITKIDSSSFIDELKITYEIIGTVYGSDYLNLDLKCYDSEGFLIDSVLIMGSVSNGERFKLSNTAYIPTKTVKIEIAGD